MDQIQVYARFGKSAEDANVLALRKPADRVDFRLPALAFDECRKGVRGLSAPRIGVVIKDAHVKARAAGPSSPASLTACSVLFSESEAIRP